MCSQKVILVIQINVNNFLNFRIVNTFAEEAAMEDTIYYISEAFRSGKMDLEQFQKQIRALSRKQFMLRAILMRCREKAGLAGGGGEVGPMRRY